MSITKYSPEFRKQLLEKYEKYINETECPFTKQFCVDNGIPSSTFYEFDEFTELSKKANDKGEMYFLKQMINNKGNQITNMFLLKCLYQYREQSPIQIDAKQNKYIQINLAGKSLEEIEDLAVKRARQIKSNRITKK